MNFSLLFTKNQHCWEQIFLLAESKNFIVDILKKPFMRLDAKYGLSMRDHPTFQPLFYTKSRALELDRAIAWSSSYLAIN